MAKPGVRRPKKKSTISRDELLVVLHYVGACQDAIQEIADLSPQCDLEKQWNSSRCQADWMLWLALCVDEKRATLACCDLIRLHLKREHMRPKVRTNVLDAVRAVEAWCRGKIWHSSLERGWYDFNSTRAREEGIHRDVIEAICDLFEIAIDGLSFSNWATQNDVLLHAPGLENQTCEMIRKRIPWPKLVDALLVVLAEAQAHP